MAMGEFEELLKRSKQGDLDAQIELGNCYYNGKGVEQDYLEAIKWYLKAANQGNASSQDMLGDCYYNGKGVEQDYLEAVKWYSKAANQGNKWSQNSLGRCYKNGYGIERNPYEAVKWYEKSGMVSRDLIEELKVPTIVIKEVIDNGHFKFSDADVEIFGVMSNGDTYAIELTCYYMPINYTLSYKVVKNVGFELFEEDCEEEAFSLKWGEWDDNKISLLVKRKFETMK